MLSVKAGQKIYSRFEEICKGTVDIQHVLQLTLEDVKSASMSESKARSILSLTKAIADGTINLDSLYELEDIQVIKKLTSIHGIGKWTAKMYLLFVLDRQLS